jgi:hypothetical protein
LSSAQYPFFAAGANYSINNTYSNRDSQTLRNNRNFKDASQALSQAPFPPASARIMKKMISVISLEFTVEWTRFPEDLVIGDDDVLVMVNLLSLAM